MTQGRSRNSRGSKKEQPAPEAHNPLARLPAERAAVIVAEEIRDNPQLLERPEIQSVLAVMSKSHSGPLPAPEDFAAYEKALPGSCDRIIAMAEKQQDYFYSINTKRIEGDLAEAKRGQNYALIIALVALGLCAWTAHIGAAWQVSSGLGAAGVGLLIAPFLRRPPKEEK